MTQTKFYCEEHSERFIQVMNIKKRILIIYEEGNEMEDGFFTSYVELTIKDAERLMDDLHNAICKIEKEVKNG